MGISAKHLNDGEEVVLDLHPHWWYLAKRGALLIGAIALGVAALAWAGGDQWYELAAKYGALVLVFIALVAFLARLIMWQNIDFVITTERCIYRAGVIAKNGIEIPLDRINTVFFNQGVFERLIGAGDLGIESAGENSRQEFSDIAKPASVQRIIYAEMENYELRRQDRLGEVLGGSRHQESPTDQLAKLHDLFTRGALTQQEFETEKSRLLNS